MKLLIIVAISMAALAIWFTIQTYSDQKQHIISRLDLISARIKHTLINDLEYTTYEMNYIANQIRERGTDPQFIRNLLGTFRINHKTNVAISWNMFSWVNASSKLTIDGNEGILHKPVDMSSRDYIPLTREDPGKLYMGMPVHGAVSKEWLIPAGMGVVNKQGDYIGSIVFGFDIGSLIYKLEQLLTMEGISFALINHQTFAFVTFSSNANPLKGHESLFLAELKQKQPLSEGVLSDSTLWDTKQGISFYRTLPNYPLTIITYYDPQMSSHTFWSTWSEKIIEYLLIASTVLVCLMALYKKLVQPVKIIADHAAAISKGNNVTIANTGITEIDVLAEQLRKVQAYTVELKDTHDQLKNRTSELETALNQLKTAQEIAERSDRAKEHFLSTIKHTLRNHINGISTSAQMLLSGKLGALPSDTFADYLNDIRATAEHMEQWTTHILYKEDVDIYALIDQCVAIQSKAALAKNVQLNVDMAPDILPLHADPLRLQQIIVGLLHTSLYSCVGEETIQIKVRMLEEGGKQLQITIWDNGIGITPKELQAIAEKLNNLRHIASRKSDGTDLDLASIQKLVEMHDGTFSTSSDLERGTVFIVTLPY